MWRLGGSAAILRLSWQTCTPCFTMFNMKTLGQFCSLSVKVQVGLLNCSTLKSERSHKCKINLQLVKDSNIKR